MTRGQRAALYVFSAGIAAAQYWIFSYFLGLETSVQRSLWTAAMLGSLIIGWLGVAFWASAHLPGRTRWRGGVRSSVIILAGIGGLLEEGGFESSMWAAIFLAFVAILISELFLRSRPRKQRTPQPE